MNLALGILLWLFSAGLFLGVGAFWLRKVETLDALERVVFSIPLGLGTLSLVVLALGLMRQANPVALWACVCLVAIPLSVFGFRSWPHRFTKGEARSEGIALLLAAAVLGVIGLATLAGSLAPASQWDELAYHLAVPKTYLREGRIFYVPYDHHSNFPFLLQMQYLLQLSVGNVAGAKLTHWLCGLLLALSVASFCRRHFGAKGKGSDLIAAALVVGSPLVVWESTTAYIDLGSALFTWLGFHALVNSSTAARDGASVRWLVVSAALMGFALGTKATVLGFWVMCLVGILLWNFVTERKWAKETIPHAALWASISLGIGAIWYVKTYLYTGNPVYPFAYGLFGGRYWSPENAAQYATEQANFGYGKDPLSLILSPVRVAFERYLSVPLGRPCVFTEQAPYRPDGSGGFDLGPAWLLALLPAPLLLKKLPRPAIYALLFAGGIWVFWFFVMQQGRYLLPALAALAVGAAGLWTVGGKGVRVWIGAVAAIGLLNGLVSAGGIAVQGISRLTSGKPPAFADGASGAAENWINQNAEPGEKVALFDEVKGFYLDREYVWAQPDHAAGLIPWDSYKSTDEWLADFKSKKYIWILKGPDPPSGDGRGWRKLFSEAVSGDKITEAASFGGWKVYRIP